MACLVYVSDTFSAKTTCEKLTFGLDVSLVGIYPTLPDRLRTEFWRVPFVLLDMDTSSGPSLLPDQVSTKQGEVQNTVNRLLGERVIGFLRGRGCGSASPRTISPSGGERADWRDHDNLPPQVKQGNLTILLVSVSPIGEPSGGSLEGLDFA